MESKRDLTALILNDSQLKSRFHDVNQMQLRMINQSIREAMEQGFLRPLDDKTLELLTEEVWLVTLLWLNYLEVGGEEVNEQTLDRGSEILRNIMGNYRFKKTD